MSKKLLSEKDLLEGLTSHTAHTDEFVTTSEKDWGLIRKVRIRRILTF